MDEMKSMEMTPEVGKSADRSKFNNFATGFCITGAAISIGKACFSGGKWVVNKIKNVRKKEDEDVYFPEEEE